LQITAIIFIGEKARLAVIAALDEMYGNIGQGNAGATWHGELCFSEEGHSLSGINKPWSVPYYARHYYEAEFHRLVAPIEIAKCG